MAVATPSHAGRNTRPPRRPHIKYCASKLVLPIDEITISHLLPSRMERVRVSNEVEDAVGSTLPANAEERSDINRWVANRNMEYVRKKLIPLLAQEGASVAVPELYRAMAKSFFFQLDGPLNTVAMHQKMRRRPMRYDWNFPVIFENVVPVDSKNLPSVLLHFYRHLDLLIADAAAGCRDDHPNVFQILQTAVWAKRMLILIHPGLDLNTRVSKLLFEWVLARVEFISMVKQPRIDLTDPLVRNKSINFERDGQTHEFRPFSSDFKHELRDTVFSQLVQYALGHKRNFFALIDLDLPLPSQALDADEYITFLEVDDLQRMTAPDYLFSEPEWATMRDFMIALIQHSTPQNIANDPSIASEVSLIQSLR